MNDHVQQIKDRLSIVDVVSSYVKLEKAGLNFRARCPFHNEKTPSFFVSPERNTFHCFGCSVGGDIFAFVERFEGTDFKGALKMLADRAGVELKPVDPKREDERTRLYGVLEAAASFFEETRTHHPEVASYLGGRGIGEKDIKIWRIGYAPPEWRALMAHLELLGYTKVELLGAGLVKEAEGAAGGGARVYDRFRGRVMFPIMDASGRVIAFTGRILPTAENSEYKEDTAKYLNSPETPVFHKSHALFGYSLAKLAVRRMNFSILVEGQMDVIMAHQAGYSNTVAASGTALTSDQLTLLQRLSNNIVMAFDADSAGVTAQGKGINIALGRGMDVKVAALPKGSDPADIIKKDKEVWRLAVKEAKHVIDFYLDYLEETHKDARKLRLAVGDIVIPYIARIPHRIDQAHFVSETSKRLGIAEAPIWESVREKAQDRAEVQREGNSTPLSSPVSATPEVRSERILKQLLSILLSEEVRGENERALDTVQLRTTLQEALGEEAFTQALETQASGDDKMLYELEVTYGDADKALLAKELLREWSREHAKREYEKALRELKDAEIRGEPEKVSLALARCRELSAALRGQ